MFVGWLLACLTSQQQANVSQGRIRSDNFTCCHTEVETADQTVYLTQQQYAYTGPPSPSSDPITPGAWQGSHCSANVLVTGMTRPGKIACGVVHLIVACLPSRCPPQFGSFFISALMNNGQRDWQAQLEKKKKERKEKKES